MKCPFCGNEEQVVLNTRSTHKDTCTWRRRRCTKCFEMYTTYENVQLNYIKVVKKDSKRVRFNRAKLFASIYHSFYNLKEFDNGDSAQISEEVTKDIEQYLVENQIQEITTGKLSKVVIEILKKRDMQVAINYYVYFCKPRNKLDLKRF